MSYSYINDIKPLQDQGVSNADIAAHLSNRTARPMQSAESIYELQNTGAGTLIDYWQGLPDGQEKDLLAFFLSTLYDGNPVRTDQYPRSTQYALAELNMTPDLQLVAESLVNLAGGRPDQGTTEADVVASQQAYEAEQVENAALAALDQQYWSLHNTYIAPLQDARNTSSAAWKAGIQSMADNWVE
jgi:hypothetical protein